MQVMRTQVRWRMQSYGRERVVFVRTYLPGPGGSPISSLDSTPCLPGPLALPCSLQRQWEEKSPQQIGCGAAGVRLRTGTSHNPLTHLTRSHPPPRPILPSDIHIPSHLIRPISTEHLNLHMHTYDEICSRLRTVLCRSPNARHAKGRQACTTPPSQACV